MNTLLSSLSKLAISSPSIRSFSFTPSLAALSSVKRMMDLRRKKMLVHKRRKRWTRDHYDYQKKQLQKKMKSEVVFRARMKELTDEFKTFDAMAYVKDTINRAEKQWELIVAPSGRKKYPHWSQATTLEEIYGIEPTEYIDKRTGFPSPEDKAAIAQAREDYLKKYSR